LKPHFPISLPNLFCVESITDADCKPMADLFAKTFCAGDPLELATGITEAEFAEMVCFDFPLLLRDNLTLALREKATGVMVGAFAALDAATPFENSTGKISPKFRPVASIVNTLHHPYMEQLKPAPGSCVYLYMIGIQSAWQGQGLAQALAMAMESRSRSLGYSKMVAITTNVLSFRIFTKLAFIEQTSRSYQNFVFENSPVFASIDPLHRLSLLEKSWCG
jgi:GNAT superfamily N-acetyltransferase